MIFSLAQIIQWILAYRYFVLLPIAIVEGPIISIIAGFMISLGHFDFLPTYGVLILGDIFGDALYYSLGRWGGRRLIDKWGRYVGITVPRVERVERHFAKHSGKTLVMGKLTHAMSALFLTAAGAVRMPFVKFMAFCTIATLPKSLVLMMVGYYFGHAYTRLNQYIDYGSLIIIGLALAILLSHIAINKRRQHEE